MKRIWFGAALLAVLLISGFASSAWMEKIHLSLSDDLSRAAELALEENWAGAESFTKAAHREWDKRRDLIASLSDHEPMDQIEGLFAQLDAFARAKDRVSYSSTCIFLARQLEALGQGHRLSLPNFF